MSTITNVPEVVNNFNAYLDDGQKENVLVGVTGSVELPNFDAITEEITGAGILGSYEASIPGHYSSIAQTIPFRILDSDIFSLMNPSSPVTLTLRAASQSTVKESAKLAYNKMKIVMKGRLKSFTPGTLEQGKQMNASVTLEVLYVLIQIDDETKLEYDKLNSVFKVNGNDLLATINEYT